MIVIVAIGTCALVTNIYAQENPYREDGWAKPPNGRRLGQMSAVDIDRNDNLYVTDNQSDGKTNPGGKRGVRIGSVNDGKVNLFIPGLGGNPESQSAGEAVAADAAGNVYWAETTGMVIRKFFKQ